VLGRPNINKALAIYKFGLAATLPVRVRKKQFQQQLLE
jgi:hypothetical protein